MNLDHELRRAFARTPAPLGLADRVLARIEQLDDQLADRPEVAPSATLRHRAVLSLTAAAVVIVTVGGGNYYSHYRTAAEAERVQHEVRQALQLTGEKLALVQRILQEPHR